MFIRIKSDDGWREIFYVRGVIRLTSLNDGGEVRLVCRASDGQLLTIEYSLVEALNALLVPVIYDEETKRV